MSTSTRTSERSSITTTERYQMIGFFIFLAVFGFAAFISTQQYLGMFFIAFVVTIVLYPVYIWLVKKLRIKMLASFTTMVFFIIILVIPLSIIGIIAINQGVAFFTGLLQDFSVIQVGAQITTFFTAEVFPGLSEEGTVNLEKIAREATLYVVSALSSAALYIASNGMKLLIEFGIFLLFLTFFFPEKENILTGMKKLMPFSVTESNYFIDRFAAITKKLSISVVVVPIVDGFLMWFILALLGVESAVFWAVITGIVSLLPVIGVSLIWIPATIIFAIQGEWVSAIIMGLYGLIVMNFADNIVRAKLLKGEQTQVPELVTILSAIGGIFAFGFFGLFYGPIIVIIFLALLDIYKNRLHKKEV
ncbi:MAG: AI-2E family transporter [Patescibacteria group bacterium]|nr:AI-2E family transporter [Patescibacteria group bacterium]